MKDYKFNRAKGTAFIKYKRKKGASQAILQASINEADSKHLKSLTGGIVINDRTIIVLPAVHKKKAQDFIHIKEQFLDKKNLYLSHEGNIKQDSILWQNLSKNDQIQRINAKKEKLMKLKNPNYIISKYRLCIRNLPLNISEKKLKLICKQAVLSGRININANEIQKDLILNKNSLMNWKEIPIKQIIIIRDKNRISSTTGQARSKKYGFIEFKYHLHALACLRFLNNNPNIFTIQARPIIEFALDDQRKLHIRKKRQKQIDKQNELKNIAQKNANQQQEDEEIEKKKKKKKKKKEEEAFEEETI